MRLLVLLALAAPDRAAYVERALAAVRELGPVGRAELDRKIYAAARTRCHGDTQAPATSCLIEAASEVCGGDARCTAAADVIVTNLASIADFVDEPTRVRLLRGSTDYHTALGAVLQRRYATLAAELVLAGQQSSDATAIDRLCADRDRTVHACAPGDAACIASITWPRCVAALVWYVGGAR